MDGLLTAVKTVTRDSRSSLLTVSEGSHRDDLHRHDETGPTAKLDKESTSSDHILAVLRSKPSHGGLSEILSILDPSNHEVTATQFDFRVPSPITAQILTILATITIPDYWESLSSRRGSKSENHKLRAALLRCFSSVAGLSCLVTQLRSLITATRSSSQHAKGSSSHIHIRNILSVLAALLKPKDFALRLYSDIEALYNNETQKQLTWKEFVSLIAASKVLSTAAEALTLVEEPGEFNTISWVGEGTQYACWLGTNICHMVSKIPLNSQTSRKSVASLTGRALSLGYTDQLVREIYTGLLMDQDFSKQYDSFFDHLRSTEQLIVLEVIFRDIERKYFLEEILSANYESISDEVVNGVAALCSIIICKRPHLESQLVDWLSKGQGGSIQTSGLRRSLLVNLAYQKDTIKTLLTKSLEQSGDKFYIKHAPMRSQEANTQVVLLSASYLQRLDTPALKDIGRSGVFLNTVSNRLAASSTRARFFGMIIGTAISQLIEEPGKAMRFDLEEMESDEALWYLSLIKMKDQIGSLKSIQSPEDQPLKTQRKSAKAPLSMSTTSARPRGQQSVKIVSIEEIEDSEDDEMEEDEELIPYEKPDADPSDSDDDPTLIQRNKPTPPVYIRDLIAGLRDTENVERYELAVTTAPSLIRRKTGFGTELAERTEELALVVVGFQEQSKLPKFHEYRLQSMIALIVSQPLKMGRWFSAIFFDGDLSQAQRSAVLIALGLSARELAGNGEEDTRMLGLPAMPDSSFPSKKLPANLEALYASNESPIARLTKQLSQASLEPLAANAADAASGPNALKVRTFSSRMEVEKKRQQRDAQRQKSTVKDFYKVLSDGFFYPLKGRFEMMMLQFSSSTAPSHNPFLTPHLLCLFIQTLTLMLSTMGPHTPFLPNLTQETLSFLLSLHTRPVSDEPTILSALLSFFLAVVDLNVASGTSGEERLVTECATQVIELREWASEVFDRTPAATGGNDPREQVRTLAAGVMVKLGEVIERYQGRLMGVNAGFKY